VTAVLIPLAALAFLWLFPAGCDLRGDPVTYRRTCLLPGLLTTVPIALAFLLTLVLALNQRRERPLPDGWLVVVPAAGAFTQVVLFGGYLLLLDPVYRGSFLAELLYITQPFVAGAVAGGVFWVSLNLGPCRP
jgi:hypothetical protein